MSSSNLALLPNVQFLYELHLATLELSSFCSHSEVLPDFRSFTIRADCEVNSILKRSAYIGSADGVLSDYAKLTQHNMTRAFNQYITHWFYPYKGKYHPQMVRALANILNLREGDTLLDPFIGSGTTAVEGSLLGLKVVGIDISPLCVLISKVKTNALHHLSKIEKSCLKDSMFEENAADYKVRNQLRSPVKSFELLARMIATSDSVRRNRNFDKMLSQNRAKMLESIRLMKDACEKTGISPLPADIKIGDARKLPFTDKSVDGIITSPPYSLALNYVENDSHSLASLGYDLKRIKDEFIGVRGTGGGKIDLYEQDMEQAYSEMARVLKPSGKAAIVIGDATVNGDKVRTTEKCIETFEDLGFRVLHNVNKLIYGLYNVMQQESILVFERR
ncbi:MAG: DNA methyltransferase [Candidatus Dadabacteria bacterium]|nr:DNA methyltransferase [Candidatus Dadabacteria bacterium]